jgi:hypothetical protein
MSMRVWGDENAEQTEMNDIIEQRWNQPADWKPIAKSIRRTEGNKSLRVFLANDRVSLKASDLFNEICQKLGVDAESDGSKKNAGESTVGSVSADELREVFDASKMASHNDCEVAEGGIALGKSSDVNSARLGGFWCKQSNRSRF